MANKKSQKPVAAKTVKTEPAVTPANTGGAVKKSLWWAPYLIVFVFSVLLYSNTLWNRFAIDDTIVLTDNKFTKKGFGGIKDHFTHDMFEGFFGERGATLVSGGRYRPLSMASLSVEYGIMRLLRGDKRGELTEKTVILTDNDPYLAPMLSHFINVFLFALTVLLLYHLLLKILPAKYSIKTPMGDFGIAFITAMLYAAHPLHTEAVANIKGRDEVMCMLFSLWALLHAVNYVKTQKIVQLVLSALIFFIALLSKENAITFLAVVPLVYFFFTKAKAQHYLFTTATLVVVTGIFLLLRSMYTHAGLTDESPEILNNPFVNNGLGNYAEFGIRYGTTFYTFLKYYGLMLLPHPLTHDYYFNQVPYVGFGSWQFMLSFLITIGLVVFAFIMLRKKNLAAFGILFFFITFSVASNIFFTVGVLMNERFIYMSSLGFCILLAYLFINYIKPRWALITVLAVVLSLYSFKTFSRNFDWKDSFTLFRRDAQVSTNSAKIQTSLGGDLTKAAQSNISALRDSDMIKSFLMDLGTPADEAARLQMLPDSSVARLLLDSSIVHLNEAVRIYPYHSNAWLMLGNAIYQRNHKAAEVIPIYQKAGAFRQGGYYDAYFNLGVVYNELELGNKAVNADSAKVNLLRAFAIKPEQVECRYLLAQIYAKLNKPDSVEYWLSRGAELRDATAGDYYSIGKNFGQSAGNFDKAIEYLDKAIAINPKAEQYYEDKATAYGFSGRYKEAIATSEELLKINPNYAAAYMNMYVSYGNLGNKQKALECYEAARKLNPAIPPLNKPAAPVPAK